jgi:hypothetical protein
MSKRSEKETLRAEAIATLRKLGVKPGATVYTIVTHVARSGMSRHIRCYIVTRDTRSNPSGEGMHVEHGITDITGLVANACGFTRARGSSWDLVVGGCGMDMCFHVVYTLGRRMFPNGGPLSKTNGIRERQAQSAGEAREVDGGYLLNKRDL